MPASYSSLWRYTHLEVHALIGITRQTLNRVSHNQHKMRITQATSNSLEYLLALHRRKVKNPSQSPRLKLETITNLFSTILVAPSHLGGSNHQDKQVNPIAKHNHQVSLDAITQAMHWIHSQSHKDDESMMEMTRRALAKLTRLLYQCKWPRE